LVGLKGLICRRGVGIVKFGGKENPGILVWQFEDTKDGSRVRDWTNIFEIWVFRSLLYLHEIADIKIRLSVTHSVKAEFQGSLALTGVDSLVSCCG
jgi:hypothetical protein